MKIVFIGGRNIRVIGGIETYMYNLCTNLAKNGHDVTYYCESNKNEVEYLNNFRVIHQNSINNIFLCKLLLSFKASIISIFKDRKVDIYHYNGTGPGLFSWIPMMFFKNVIVQSHGLEWKRTKWTPRQRNLLKKLHNFVMFFCKNITSVSEEQSLYIRKFNKKKSVTVPTAVNLPKQEINSDILERFNLKKNDYFLFLGRLVKEKNPDILLEAYIKSKITTKKLVIAGDNEKDSNFVDYLHQFKNKNTDIIFTGSVTGDDKEMLLKESFAFCIPSTIEGLSITLLEAMSYSKICIASDIPSCKEALGNSGVWVKAENIEDLSEKLKYVTDNFNLIKYQEKENYNRVIELYTWDNITKQYENYCKSIIRK